jgi:hypothetical protein
MGELLMLFAVLGSLAGILATVALWAPRRMWVKLGALGVTAVFLPAGYFGLSEMLSRPKPVGLELTRLNLAEATVLGSRLDEDKAIYLWLGIPGVEEPRAYTLPWDQQLARQLQGAKRESEDTGVPVQMRKPFENSMDQREKVFYTAPPPPPPEKAPPDENPLNFQGTQGAPQD